MGRELWELALWISKRYLCSPGIALKTVLPGELLQGSSVCPPSSTTPLKEGAPVFNCIYDGIDAVRHRIYADILGKKTSSRGLFIFPEIEQARAFWTLLQEKELCEKGALWDISGNRKRETQFLLWKDIQQKKISFLVGSLGAIFAPFDKLDFIVIDQEESGAYENRKTPFFHARSVLAKRGHFFSSHVYFGGRVPSSRVFLNLKPVFRDPSPVSFSFVHLSRALPLALEGTEKEIPLSKKLFEKSVELQQKKEKVLWIFDRSDENRELFCIDCGYVFTCPYCGGTWELTKSGESRCTRCGSPQVAPVQCPQCKGEILSYRGAGLRTLHTKLSSFLGQGVSCYLFDRKKKNGGVPLRELVSSGGIILGTRKALSLCDILPISFIAWLDADAEARRSNYNSQEKAFRMVWESCWRGVDKVSSRTILLQSRNPRREWQQALEKGWAYFWKEELEKRKAFSFPPYGTLVEVSANLGILNSLKEELEKEDVAFASLAATQEEEQETLWVKCSNTAPVYRAVRSVFDIRNPLAKKRKNSVIRIWRD